MTQHLMAAGCEGHFPLTDVPPGQLQVQVPEALVQADSWITPLPIIEQDKKNSENFLVRTKPPTNS